MKAVLGVNMAFHESAAALVVDGELVAACEEERFNRIKHGKSARVDTASEAPVAAIAACLDIAGIHPKDIDVVALSFSSALRASRFEVDELSVAGDWGSRGGEDRFAAGLAATPEAVRLAIGEGFAGRIVEVPHHLAHAASAFYPSGFDTAAVLVADGIGEDAASAIYAGKGVRLIERDSFDYPDSIGFLWEKLSRYLGFSEYDACKTMGLAAYGDSQRFAKAMASLFSVRSDGSYRVDRTLARFRLPEFTALERLFGPQRRDDEAISQHHYDVAAALQDATTTAIAALAHRAVRVTGYDRLCLAGGVALNCVTNAALNRDPRFADIYVPPAPNDAGTAIGAALHVWSAVGGSLQPVTQSPYLGPDYDQSGPGTVTGDFDRTIAQTVDLLCDERIVGWFQGRMEFGPRALGNRSLLADPRSKAMREILNRKVKHREDFRPFAPSVLREKAHRWFDLGRITASHGYMLFTVPVRPERAHEIPAVLHVDGSARVQIVDRQTNPRYHALISAFAKRTGVPLLLNTSFNDSEPIVCTPTDALATFRKTSIDAVVVGDTLLRRPEMAVAW